jgi:hypothetical protein
VLIERILTISLSQKERYDQLTSSITWCLETELVRSLLSDSGYWVSGRRGRVGSVDACGWGVGSKSDRSVGDWAGYMISYLLGAPIKLLTDGK